MTEPAPAPSIMARTAKGAGWTIGWRLLTRALGVASTLILVRFLSPADFGIAALGTAFAAAVESLTFLGVEEALVRERSPGRAHYDTGFTLNVIRGTVLASVIAGLAAPAARFFSEPGIAPVLLTLAAITLLEGFTNIGIVDFRRTFAFQREFLALTIPRLIGLAAMISAAVLFRSYWAILAGITCHRLAAIASSYLLHPFRPRFSLAAWSSLAGYSFWTWVTALVNLLRERSDSFIIGRMLGSVQLGFYSLGAELALVPTTELIVPLSRAAFSGFSAARNEGGDAVESFVQMVSAATMLLLPAGIGLSLMAEPIVALVLGQAWIGAVPVVQVLGAAGALSVFSYLGITFLNAHAMLRPVLLISAATALTRVMLLVAWLVVWPKGLLGGAIAVAASILMGGVLCMAVLQRRLGLDIRRLLLLSWRSVAAVLAMALVITLAGLNAAPPQAGVAANVVRGSAGILAGAATYTSVLLALWMAAGRPDGGEAQLLRLAKAAAARWGARRRRA